MDGTPANAARFVRTAHVARRERTQGIAGWVFGAMAVAMVAPLVGIVGYLLYRAYPSLP